LNKKPQDPLPYRRQSSWPGRRRGQRSVLNHVHNLAYFIVRQPRGLIAAALQYGHVNSKVTLSYAGRSDTSWLDDLAVEKLEMVLEQSEFDAAILRAGEHVSGPSAAEYRIRVERAAAFAGRTVTGVRNVTRLLASVDPDVHHGEAMTCVYRAETAACRAARVAGGMPAGDGPDDSECRSTCANLAYIMQATSACLA
jgi:hypothetical protein